MPKKPVPCPFEGCPYPAHYLRGGYLGCFPPLQVPSAEGAVHKFLLTPSGPILLQAGPKGKKFKGGKKGGRKKQGIPIQERIHRGMKQISTFNDHRQTLDSIAKYNRRLGVPQSVIDHMFELEGILRRGRGRPKKA